MNKMRISFSSSSFLLLVLLCFMFLSFVLEGVSARVKGDYMTEKLSSVISVKDVAEQLQGGLGEPRCGKSDPNSCCSPGRCCSKFGWCGSGFDYCGKGNCQSQCPCQNNGVLPMDDPEPMPRIVSEVEIEAAAEIEMEMETEIGNSTSITFQQEDGQELMARNDYRCGRFFPNSCCSYGRCCSTSGWCGSGPDYCGAGRCQSQCYCSGPLVTKTYESSSSA